ncbi:Anaphase-promoting complex subunit [Arachis hypogaea]|nr:Anaphase-promoting complex subunit [Arachis hypogaea]
MIAISQTYELSVFMLAGPLCKTSSTLDIVSQRQHFSNSQRPQDIDVPGDSASKLSENVRVASPYGDPSSNMLRDDDPSGAVFLRTNWQLQGYLQEQDDIIEKNGVAVSLNGLNCSTTATEVHFLSYLNSLSHDDYIAALENLYCYLDYRKEKKVLVAASAAAVAHSLFCICYKYNLQVENASVLLLLAEIHKLSCGSLLDQAMRFHHSKLSSREVDNCT